MLTSLLNHASARFTAECPRMLNRLLQRLLAICGGQFSCPKGGSGVQSMACAYFCEPMKKAVHQQDQLPIDPQMIPARERKDGRVTVDGKFFRLGAGKFYLKGLTYGPFAPDEGGDTFATPEQTVRDFTQIRALGANLLRVYYVPPRSWLDLAAEHGLKVLIDIPWAKHLCFLDSKKSQEQARQTVQAASGACKGHPAVFAFSMVNEISAEIVRWSGVAKVERFIDSLLDEAKSIDPHCLCT